MARHKRTASGKANGGATVWYEAELWLMAVAVSGSMDAAERKHVGLGQIFLRCFSDAHEGHHARFVAVPGQGIDPEDPDEHRALNILWVPPEARSKDALARVYEYFLSQFASARGKKVGERRLFGVLQPEEQAGSPARRPAPTRITAVAFTEG